MTNERRIDLFMESYYDSYFTEKKTKEEYSMEKFKKKYKFIPDKTKGGNDPRRGTIDPGNGHRVKVDFGKNKTIIINDDSDDKIHRKRKLAYNPSKNTIVIDDIFFNNIKDQKRRDAILQHEVGHSELHNVFINGRTNSNNKIIEDVLSDQLKDAGLNVDDPVLKSKIRLSAESIYRKINSGENRIKNPDARLYIRNEARKIMKKESEHESTDEYEADSYAVSPSGLKNFKKGFRDYNRKDNKKEKNDKENVKRINNENNRRMRFVSNKKHHNDIKKIY